MKYAWEHKAGKTEVYNTGDRSSPSGKVKQPEQAYTLTEKILIVGFGILCPSVLALVAKALNLW